MSGDHRSMSEIEADLAKNRVLLSRNLELLQHRFSFDGAVDAAKQAVTSNAGDISAAVSRAVRTNPLAVALIGAGLVWLATGKSPGFGTVRRPVPDSSPTRPLDTWADEGGTVWHEPEYAASPATRTTNFPHWANAHTEE